MSTSRRDFIRAALALVALDHSYARQEEIGSATPFEGKAPLNSSRNQLWYNKPAERWLEALPVGNGRLGGMVYGGTQMERIALSESTAWSGAPAQGEVNPDALTHLNEIRQLFFSGKHDEAQKLCGKYLPGH